jgi:hypothetical protein
MAAVAAGSNTVDRTQVVAKLRQLEQMGWMGAGRNAAPSVIRAVSG